MATPLGCLQQAGDVYEVRLISNAKDREILLVEIWRDGRLAYSWTGHTRSVFRILRHHIFYADFRTSGEGGEIVSVDLDTGKEMWRSPLRAVGPVQHSVYRNELNLDANRDAVLVHGVESGGRYFEVKSAQTGETIAHRIYPSAIGPNGREGR